MSGSVGNPANKVAMPSGIPINHFKQLITCITIGSWMVNVGMGYGYGMATLESIKTDSDLEFEFSQNKEIMFKLMFFLGASIGALLGGILSDKFGRKVLLTSCGGPVIAAGFICLGYARWFELILVGRFLTGIGSGTIAAVVPMYLTEVTSIEKRNPMGILVQFFFIIGVFNAVMTAYMLDYRKLGWIGAVSVVPNIVGTLFRPESPVWLVQNGKKEIAAKALSRIRGMHYDRQAEVKYLASYLVTDPTGRHQRSEPATSHTKLLQICLATVLLCTHSISGFLDILEKLPETFSITLGLSVSPILLLAGFLGAQVILLFVIAGILLTAARRKRVFLVTTSLATLFLFVTGIVLLMVQHVGQFHGWQFVSASSLLLFLSFANLGPVALGWTMSVEVLSTGAKRVGGSMPHAARWATAGLIAYVSDTTDRRMEFPISCLVYGGCLLACLAFLIRYLPETGGKTEPEIMSRFGWASSSATRNPGL